MDERAESGPDAPIYVLDELVIRPGRLQAFLEALEARYRPGAEARGQRLLHRWVTPPTATEGVEQTLMLVWQLDGVPGFWRMRSQNAAPEIAGFWAESESFVASRSRRFAAAPAAVEGFDALGRLNA